MTDRLRAELQRIAEQSGAGDLPFTLERPRDPSHGDVATNLALLVAKRERSNPRAIAEQVIAGLDLPADFLTSAEIAGPGFINFRLASGTLTDAFDRIISEGAWYSSSDAGKGLPVNVEFVSANPTGPLHVGHGRGAALGDGIAALLEWTGHRVTREFYVNDAGAQITRARGIALGARAGGGRPCRRDSGWRGYHGAYLQEAAAALLDREGKAFADLPASEGIARCRAAALTMQRAEQDATLGDFGVRFDVTSSRSSRCTTPGKLAAALERLTASGLTFEEGGALWLRTTAHGDDRDRVLRKSDGTYTYLVPDIAYHLDKFARGFTHVIDVWGADHHGYIPRMQAALAALGLPAGWLDVAIVQLVRVVRGDEEVKMSKRSGEFVTLRDLYEEVGVDAARYWFLMRRGDSHLVFDIEPSPSRARTRNPVYYVQMAHARMSGISRNAPAWRRTRRKAGSRSLRADRQRCRFGQEAHPVPRCGGTRRPRPRAPPDHDVPRRTRTPDARLVSHIARARRSARRGAGASSWIARGTRRGAWQRPDTARHLRP